MYQSDSVTFKQWTATLCNNYRVLELHSVTATHCYSYTMWQLQNVAATL